MQTLYIGVFTARISSPHGLSRQQRWDYASSFLRTIEAELSRHPDVRLHLDLYFADSGCIKLKAKVFLRISGALATAGGVTAAGISLVQFQETARSIAFLKERYQTTYACNVDGKPWACTLLTCDDIRVSTTFHKTVAGDTLQRVIAEVWMVPIERRAAVLNTMRRVYAGLLKDANTGELVPGMYIALLQPAMCDLKR